MSKPATFSLSLSLSLSHTHTHVPAGSPSRGGDIKVYVLDINQPSLPTPFTLFLCLFLSYGPFTYISFQKSSRQLSAFSLSSPSLISAFLVLSTIYLFLKNSLNGSPKWGAADAEIKVPSGENTELKRSLFKAWSMSVYSHTCCAYCQGFLPCLFLHFRCIHLHFYQTSPDIIL